MARPKLPAAQRKGMVMTVQLRLDLNDGLAAVALLRGTTKSGLVSQYAAELIRFEQERDRVRFDAALEDIRFQSEARRRKKSAQSPFERPSSAPDCLKAITHQPELIRPWCLESRPHDRLVEPLYDTGKKVIQATRGRLSLLAREKRTPCGDSRASLDGINPAEKIANKLHQ
jgi:hypothetical protein